jgi:GxxExxY protein
MSDEQNSGDDKRDPQTHALLGAAFEVHRILGCGFLEQVYEQALIVELVLRQIPVEIEPVIGVRYKTERLATVFRPDLVCFGG